MYQTYLQNMYENVPGVTVIDSGVPGPTIGVLAITHGNEKAGLMVFDHLVNRINLSHMLSTGKIFLIAVNIAAYQYFIQQDDPYAYRFIDHNMNRIHTKPFQEDSYEFQRKSQLEPILDEIDIILDLHSVQKGEDVICIADKKSATIAKDIFDVQTILLDDIVTSGALIGYVVAQGKVGFGLECGNHVSPDGYKIGIDNTLRLLSYYGCIDKEYTKQDKQHTPATYSFLSEIFPQSSLFHYTKNFSNFDMLTPQDVFAQDGTHRYINTYNKNIYIGFIKKEISPNDGCGFLFEKIS